MTEYFKIQGYTDEQIKRALIFIDNQEYYQFTNQIIEEIVTNVNKTNENINEMTINTNQEIVKSLDPLEQLNKGYINLDYIHILSPTIYDSNKLRSVLSDAIVNIKSSDLESKIDTHTNTLNGLKEIVYVFDMIKNTIPQHKEKDKAFIDMISLNIKEGFPELKNQIPENFTTSKETIDFINSINKSSVFKNKENYVDLQKTLHNIKEDIYSFNGLANIIIDLDNMKKNYVVGSENENKGLYEIYEIVQVYAANELLKNSYNHVEKFQDIQESKSVLEKINDIHSMNGIGLHEKKDFTSIRENSSHEVKNDISSHEIKNDDSNFFYQNATSNELLVKKENKQEQENKNDLIAKATIISYFLSKLGANENIKNLDLNNLNVQQLNELAKELKDRVVIEQNKLEEDRIKNGMVKESSLLSLTLIGLFSDDAFSKYISKEEFEEKKIMKEQEMFRLEDTLKALNQQELLNNDFTKQKETHYLQASIYDKYQDTIAIQRIYDSLNRWKESKLYDLNEKLLNDIKNDPILAANALENTVFDDFEEKIKIYKNIAEGDEYLLKETEEFRKKVVDVTFKQMDADILKYGYPLPDHIMKPHADQIIKFEKDLLNKFENKKETSALVAVATGIASAARATKAEVLSNLKEQNKLAEETAKYVETLDSLDKLTKKDKPEQTNSPTCSFKER